MNITLDPVFAAAIERELMSLGTARSRLRRRQRRVRLAAFGGGSLALVGALTGAAIISGLPGETSVTPFDETVSGSYTGTATVDLGPVPAGADRVILDVTCREGGTIEVPTNAGAGQARPGSVFWTCSDPIREKSTTRIEDGLLPSSGATTITITADAGTPWTVVARYGSSVTTSWGVNARGETYGIPNDNGVPDLIAAQATNGEVGYTRLSEQSFEGEGYVKVYKSDGETQIGWFPIGDPATLGDPPAFDE
ncbi:hypothetical protein [Microbacterium sp. H1-D42]|uniref:hypothetical protein n=1 Tax=Microbacterium sp. H1-D42 TaxID=2925844 RepID=UPI001F52BC02|nr:hypothetical protein [Microbacterium sp. H1-D42]UNK71570.1 hypothetical protein MNR00_03680 [Microbacterium sp. H1-D42]